MPDHDPISPEDDRIARLIFASAPKVHAALGPGLLESVYSGCLTHEMAKAGLAFRREVALPVIYDDVHFEAGFRIDFLVEERVLIEVKAVEVLHPAHTARLLTYLKLSDRSLGRLANFNVPLLKEGVKRLVR